jgi:hypothetical protein
MLPTKGRGRHQLAYKSSQRKGELNVSNAIVDKFPWPISRIILGPTNPFIFSISSSHSLAWIYFLTDAPLLRSELIDRLAFWLARLLSPLCAIESLRINGTAIVLPAIAGLRKCLNK